LVFGTAVTVRGRRHLATPGAAPSAPWIDAPRPTRCSTSVQPHSLAEPATVSNPDDHSASPPIMPFSGVGVPEPPCHNRRMPQTLSEKVWERHVVRRADGEPDLLYIDLHLVHEVTSPQAFDGLRMNGRTVRRADLTVATMDHNVPTVNIDQPIA